MSVNIPSNGGHPDDDAFELYVLNRLSEVDRDAVDEHLLVCEDCRQKLTESEEFVGNLRAALEAERVPPPEPARAWSWWPRGAWAACAVAAAVLAVIVVIPPSAGTPAIVELHAIRASEVANAPAGRVLDLRLDLNGLAQSSSYRVEIVDSEGRRVFETRAGADAVPVRVDKKLDAGQYWVRLYDDGNSLVREFGFAAK